MYRKYHRLKPQSGVPVNSYLLKMREDRTSLAVVCDDKVIVVLRIESVYQGKIALQVSIETHAIYTCFIYVKLETHRVVGVHVKVHICEI